ncbi:transposase [Bradyrhizobium sp. 191]|uniref:transposase n=1 Tax=Bradyrhizobium sp. 191 TaxID=2782659 RepID=UPI001FFFCAE0|nr:transposase [Bradyrhizobium sp. 191]
MKPDARVCDVARCYGVKAQQLTTWRRLARAGRLALVTVAPASFWSTSDLATMVVSSGRRSATASCI